MGFNCLKAMEPLRGDSLPAELTLSHAVVLNLGHMDLESSTLTTRPLLHDYCIDIP